MDTMIFGEFDFEVEDVPMNLDLFDFELFFDKWKNLVIACQKESRLPVAWIGVDAGNYVIYCKRNFLTYATFIVDGQFSDIISGHAQTCDFSIAFLSYLSGKTKIYAQVKYKAKRVMPRIEFIGSGYRNNQIDGLIVVTYLCYQGHYGYLPESGNLLIGRTDENHFALKINQISSPHLEIICQNNNFFAKDLKSTNGTGFRQGSKGLFFPLSSIFKKGLSNRNELKVPLRASGKNYFRIRFFLP